MPSPAGEQKHTSAAGSRIAALEEPQHQDPARSFLLLQHHLKRMHHARYGFEAFRAVMSTPEAHGKRDCDDQLGPAVRLMQVWQTACFSIYQGLCNACSFR